MPDQVTNMSTDARTARARQVARKVTAILAAKGVNVKVVGSLAEGRFGPHSDIDFLVVECPRELKYRIEGDIEDAAIEFRFDAVYLDEIPEHRVHRFKQHAVDADDLHDAGGI